MDQQSLDLFTEGVTRRQCAECGDTLEPYKRAEGYQKYCSHACRQRVWAREQKLASPRDKPTRGDRILARLREGAATGLDLLRSGGGLRYSARIKELRSQGHWIIGPLAWKRPDGSIVATVTQPTPDGHEVYRLEER